MASNSLPTVTVGVAFGASARGCLRTILPDRAHACPCSSLTCIPGESRCSMYSSKRRAETRQVAIKVIPAGIIVIARRSAWKMDTAANTLPASNESGYTSATVNTVAAALITGEARPNCVPSMYIVRLFFANTTSSPRALLICSMKGSSHAESLTALMPSTARVTSLSRLSAASRLSFSTAAQSRAKLSDNANTQIISPTPLAAGAPSVTNSSTTPPKSDEVVEGNMQRIRQQSKQRITSLPTSAFSSPAPSGEMRSAFWCTSDAQVVTIAEPHRSARCTLVAADPIPSATRVRRSPAIYQAATSPPSFWCSSDAARLIRLRRRIGRITVGDIPCTRDHTKPRIKSVRSMRASTITIIGSPKCRLPCRLSSATSSHVACALGPKLTALNSSGSGGRSSASRLSFQYARHTVGTNQNTHTREKYDFSGAGGASLEGSGATFDDRSSPPMLAYNGKPLTLAERG
eukprot:Hpha_TRINITY_DN14813_c4_g8::TRINITY_DN14813_c4_g8_i1::g.170368::m.170368